MTASAHYLIKFDLKGTDRQLIGLIGKMPGKKIQIIREQISSSRRCRSGEPVGGFLEHHSIVTFHPSPRDVMAVASLDQLIPKWTISLHPIPTTHRGYNITRVGKYLDTAGTPKFRKSLHAGENFGLLIRNGPEILGNKFHLYSVPVNDHSAAASRRIRRTVSKAGCVGVDRHDWSVSLGRIATAIPVH